MTREDLLKAGYSCPEIYGDPAILLPLLYDPKKEKKYKIPVIIHYLHKNRNNEDGGVHYINIETEDYKAFVDEILSSERVISSSLHGIIVSETYGVPATFLCDGMQSEMFKYLDWYYSTNQFNVKMAASIEEAIDIGAMELPNLGKMRDGVIASFPYDVFA